MANARRLVHTLVKLRFYSEKVRCRKFTNHWPGTVHNLNFLPINIHYARQTQFSHYYHILYNKIGY